MSWVRGGFILANWDREGAASTPNGGRRHAGASLVVVCWWSNRDDGGVELAVEIVAVVLSVVIVTALADRLRTSPPLILIVAGIVISFIPGVPEYQLSPELVLIGILPPLLYSGAYNTSFIDFRANRRSLGMLSIGLVIFTTIIVGYVAWYLLPGLPLAAGFAIGAVVAPPDAVAATAVARRVGMPRSIVQTLEGESLVNDATALTCLRTAIVALAGAVTVMEVGSDFFIAAVGGVVVGLIVAFVYAPIRRRISNPSIETVLSFVIPYVAFIPAEHFHASGVIAVVVTGLIVGHKAPLLQSGTARLTSEGNWRTVSFLLENTVFLLIGLQLKGIVQAVARSGVPISQTILVCVGVFLATIAARVVWVFLSGAIDRLPMLARKRPARSWAETTVVSWAGMRGVVTLAAALSIPASISVHGVTEAFPYRDVLVLVAFVVVIGSILIQGSSLKWLVRRLRLPPPDRAESALQEAALLQEASRAGLARLDEATDESDPEDVVVRLRLRAEERSNAAWERVARPSADAETPIEAYQRLRMDMLRAEREAVLAARDDARTNDEVLRRVVRVLDVEEAMLDNPNEEKYQAEHDLVTPDVVAQTCVHLEAVDNSVTAQTPGECTGCIVEGTTWVHLRMCMTCGYVGCCDSSVSRHADRHHSETGHPVMRSVEIGEAWKWCYVDQILG